MRRCHKDGDEISIRKEAGDIKKNGEKKKEIAGKSECKFCRFSGIDLYLQQVCWRRPLIWLGLDWIGLAYFTPLYYSLETQVGPVDADEPNEVKLSRNSAPTIPIKPMAKSKP